VSVSELVNYVEDTEDIEGETFGVGLMFRSDSSGVYLNLPLSVEELGNLFLNCNTDYRSGLNCAVELTGQELAMYMKFVYEEVNGAIMMVAYETDETFQEKHKVIAAVFEEFWDSNVPVFSRTNVALTARLVEDGFLDLGNDYAVWAEAILASIDLTMHDAASPSSSNEHQSALNSWMDEEKLFHKELTNMEMHLKCMEGSIMFGSCPSFKVLDKKLAETNDDVEKALKALWDDSATALEDASAVYDAAEGNYEWVGTNEYDTFNCRVYDVHKITTSSFFRVEMSREKTYQGKSANKDCLRLRLEEVEHLVQLHKEIVSAEQAFVQERMDYADSLFYGRSPVDPNNESPNETATVKRLRGITKRNRV